MRDYAKAIQTTLAARAIWEPGQTVIPGDYGIVQDGCFLRLGSVSEIGAKLQNFEVISEGKYEFSQGLSSSQMVSAATKIDWNGEVLASLDWSGGSGIFLGAPKSSLLGINELGRVVREALHSKSWQFNWRLVRQVRTMSKGVIAFGGNLAVAGKLVFDSQVPLTQTKASAQSKRSDGFVHVQHNINGAVYAHTVRLRPWLAHGAAPLDHELWYDDDFDD